MENKSVVFEENVGLYIVYIAILVKNGQIFM